MTNQPRATGLCTENRKHFYMEFLDFVRQYPEVRIALYVPSNDLTFLTREECLPIVSDLLDFCESGRLTLMGMMPRPYLLDYLRGIRNGQSQAVLF